MPAFCHSQGRICQGGFLTGMVDTAMAHAAMAKGSFAFAVPTLELKISFLEAAGPGFVIAEGRVLRWGGSVGFLDGDIKDDKGRLVVHATSTIKIVRPRKIAPSSRSSRAQRGTLSSRLKKVPRYGSWMTAEWSLSRWPITLASAADRPLDSFGPGRR